MSEFTGKVAVVTGASKGIGASIAKALGEQGAAVVVNYNSSKDDADKVVAAIVKAGGKAVAIQADVSKSVDAKALIEAALKNFGQLDIVVNNAGIYEYGPLESITEAVFHKHFNTNVLGHIHMIQAALPYLKEGASIVNVGSSITRLMPAMTAVYTASKAAADALTKVFAKELGARRIRINNVNPGMTETEGASSYLGSDMVNSMVANTPLGRIGSPDDLAKVAVFLASDASGWMTGETVGATGGLG